MLGIELDFTGIVSFTACKTPDVDTSIISIFYRKGGTENLSNLLKDTKLVNGWMYYNKCIGVWRESAI